MQHVFSSRRRWPLTPVALAASIMLAVVGWGMYFRGDVAPNRPPTPIDRRISVTGPTAQEIADRVQVFDQVWEVFDRRAGWVLIADRASDLGLGDAPTDAAGQLLLLRLSVSQDDSLLSMADLVIVPGQIAQMTVPLKRGTQLRYQIATSAQDPTRLRLWLEVERDNGERERMGALASDLRLRPGQVMSAGQMVTSSGRYDVNVGIYWADSPGERS